MSEALQNHIQKLAKLHQQLINARDSKVISDAMLHQLETLIGQLTQHTDTAWQDTAAWLSQTMTAAPQLAPVIDRELLWFFGGDCLHFLTDEEIVHFQSENEQ